MHHVVVWMKQNANWMVRLTSSTKSSDNCVQARTGLIVARKKLRSSKHCCSLEVPARSQDRRRVHRLRRALMFRPLVRAALSARDFMLFKLCSRRAKLLVPTHSLPFIFCVVVVDMLDKPFVLLSKTLIPPTLVPLQELNNDVSDFTVSSVPESGDENLRRRDVWNGVHQSKHCPRHGEVHRNPFQRGKENALPPQATFDTCPHLPASTGFWPPQSCQFYDESHRRKPKKAASKSRFGQHHRQGQTRNRDDLLFADGGVVHECNGTDLSEASEQDLQRWLNRTAVNVGAHVLSNASARGRSNQISKMTVEGQQAQSTVAVHVE